MEREYLHSIISFFLSSNIAFKGKHISSWMILHNKEIHPHKQKEGRLAAHETF